MDKQLIMARAGSGKTSEIVKRLSENERALILTYTEVNCANLQKKVKCKFGSIPGNITITTYFKFLYHFCYNPFYSDKIKAKGIDYDARPIRGAGNYKKVYGTDEIRREYCMTEMNYFYGCRFSLYLQNAMDKIIARLEKYYEALFIDEVQDMAGNDFDFLMGLTKANIKMIFVGDYYQHILETSRDGDLNEQFFKKGESYYASKFSEKGFYIDNETLKNSHRCSKNVCDYVRNKLGIDIWSARSEDENTTIEYVQDQEKIRAILDDPSIMKLHYENSEKFGVGHINWAKSKGEEFPNICVVLTDKASEFLKGKPVEDFSEDTKKKLYVAITRTRGDCYLIDNQPEFKQPRKKRGKSKGKASSVK